jgi:hypothetical protein
MILHRGRSRREAGMRLAVLATVVVLGLIAVVIPLFSFDPE